MIIGLAIGILAYRSAYAAVFDYRYNHIPLPPFAIRTRFSYNIGAASVANGDLSNTVVGEDDELVVWSWWKQSGYDNLAKDKEASWLKSLRSARVTGKEIGPNFNGVNEKLNLEVLADPALVRVESEE